MSYIVSPSLCRLVCLNKQVATSVQSRKLQGQEGPISPSRAVALHNGATNQSSECVASFGIRAGCVLHTNSTFYIQSLVRTQSQVCTQIKQ